MALDAGRTVVTYGVGEGADLRVTRKPDRTPVTDAQSVEKILNAYGRGVIRLYFERGGQIYSTEFGLQ